MTVREHCKFLLGWLNASADNLLIKWVQCIHKHMPPMLHATIRSDTETTGTTDTARRVVRAKHTTCVVAAKPDHRPVDTCFL
jgi:hypothetical protein